MKLITILILSVVLALTVAFAAFADTFTIASGAEGGGYSKADKIFAQRLQQRGHDVTVTHNNGSDAITLQVCSGNADVGRTQIDAIFKRAQEGCRLDVAGLHGSEYAIMMVPPKSKIGELSDLGETSKVLVDRAGSGSELFWRTIVGIEQGDNGNKSNWSKAIPVLEEASAAHALAAFGDVDAVIVVRGPYSADITNLIGLGWKPVTLYDKDINDQLFNGKPLYEAEKFKFDKSKVWGYIVPAFLVVKSGNDKMKSLVRSVL